MKKKLIIFISILTLVLSLTGVFVFAYFNFFYQAKGSDIVLENVKFELNGNKIKSSESVVYITEDDLVQGSGDVLNPTSGYELVLNYSLDGKFVSNYAMKYNTYFEVSDSTNVAKMLDLYRFDNDSYQYLGKLGAFLSTDDNMISVYEDYLGTNAHHTEKFLIVYPLGESLNTKFALKVSTISETVTTTSSEFPYYYLNDMGASGDAGGETAESIFKRLVDTPDVYDRTIVLMRDIEFDSATNINFTHLVGIDLNGHTLDLAGGTLTIGDSAMNVTKYHPECWITDSVGTGKFVNSTIKLNMTKSVMDIDSVFYKNAAKLDNSNIIIQNVGIDAFSSYVQDNLDNFAKTKKTVSAGAYSFDYLGNLKYYVVRNSVTPSDIYAVAANGDEITSSFTSDYKISLSGIGKAVKASLSFKLNSKVVNANLDFYANDIDSADKYIHDYIPAKLTGSIYLPTYISIFDAYITWISYDENLITPKGSLLPNGYFDLDNWASKTVSLAYIIDANGETISGVIKDIEIVILTEEERANLLYDFSAVVFDNETNTSYDFDLISLIKQKYNSNDVLDIASTYFNITATDEADFVSQLKTKLGLADKPLVVTSTADSIYLVNTLTDGSITKVEQNGVPQTLTSIIYEADYKFENGYTATRTKPITITSQAGEVTLVDLTNTLRVPFDTYTDYMTTYTTETVTRNSVTYQEPHYNKYKSQFNLVRSFNDTPVTYVVPAKYSNYVRINETGDATTLEVVVANVPAETNDVTIEAHIQGSTDPIYLTFTCVGVLHNGREIEDANLYVELLGMYDANNDLILTDLEAKNSTNTKLYIRSRGIYSLVGLRYFKQLKTLDLEKNKITNIEDLAELTELTYIDLNSNNLTDLSALKYLDKLSTLTFGSNQVTSIEPIRNLVNLTRLRTSGNNIVDFSPVQDLVKLRNLYVQNNTTTDGHVTADLSMATSSGYYNDVIKGNQYYFNLLKQKDSNLLLYEINDDNAYVFEEYDLTEAFVLSTIEPIYAANNKIVLPTIISSSGLEDYEITYISPNYSGYIDIQRDVSNKVTNITLNPTAVDVDVIVYANTIGLNGSKFYRPFKFKILKGTSDDPQFGQIEVATDASTTVWVDGDVLVPDKNLLARIFLTFDTNDDKKISNAERIAATTLDLEFANIKNLEGLQFFTGITLLNLRGNTLYKNDDGTAKIKQVAYLTNLNTLYLNGQLFNFDDLLYYTRVKDGADYKTTSETTFEVDGNNVTLTYGLTNLTKLYVKGAFELDTYKVKQQLYHVFLTNKITYSNGTGIFVSSDTATYNPVTEEVTKLLGSLPTSAKFINYADKIIFNNEYDFYLYDDLYPTHFSLSNGAISSVEYIYTGALVNAREPNDSRYINYYDEEGNQYQLSAVDTDFIAASNHQLKSYFDIRTTSSTIEITYEKLVYKDYQAYLNMTLSATKLCDTRKTFSLSSNYYLTLFMQYNNDYVFVNSADNTDPSNDKPLNTIFGGVETLLYVMNGLSDQLSSGSRGYKYHVTAADGTITEETTENYNANSYKVTSTDVASFSWSGKYFYFACNFMPTATSAVDGLRYLPQLNKIYFRRDATLGDGSDLINVEELFIDYSALDMSHFKTVLNNMKILIVAQGKGSNMSIENDLGSNPNKLVETFLVYMPNLVEFYYDGEGEAGKIYEWSAFLAYSYIPYSQIYKKDSSNNYVYYHTENGNEYVGGVMLDSNDGQQYYYFDETTTTDFDPFHPLYYGDGLDFTELTQSVIDEYDDVFDTENGVYSYIYTDTTSGTQLPSSYNIFRHVGEAHLNNYKLAGEARYYSNTYNQQITLREIYKNLTSTSKRVYYFIGETASPAGTANIGNFYPEYEEITYSTNVEEEYDELAPTIADLNVTIGGKAVGKVEINGSATNSFSSSTKYSEINWNHTDYSDYFEPGLKIKLPTVYEEYLTKVSSIDQYRNFTITWYILVDLGGGLAINSSQPLSMVLTNEDLFTYPNSDNKFVYEKYIYLQIDKPGYYVFEGVVELSDGVDTYSTTSFYNYNTNGTNNGYITTAETYSTAVGGMVSLIYPVTITSFKEKTYKAARDLETVRYSNLEALDETKYPALADRSIPEYYDSVVDRTFKYLILLSGGSYTKEVSLRKKWDYNNNKYSSTTVGDFASIFISMARVWGTETNGVFTVAANSPFKTFYGLKHLVSQIFTLDGFDKLSKIERLQLSHSYIRYLPDRFPSTLTRLEIRPMYGVNNYGGLFQSNVTHAYLTATETTDIGSWRAHTDSVLYMEDYVSPGDTIKLQQLVVNGISDGTVALLGKDVLNYYNDGKLILMTILNQVDAEMYFASITDLYSMSINPYVTYRVGTYGNIGENYRVTDRGYNVSSVISDLKTYYDGISNPVGAIDLSQSTNFYSQAVSVADCSVRAPQHITHNGKPVSSDSFWPSSNMVHVTYSVGVDKKISGKLNIIVLKELTGYTSTDTSDVPIIKITTFDSIKEGTAINTASWSYTKAELDSHAHDISEFDLKFVNLLMARMETGLSNSYVYSTKNYADKEVIVLKDNVRFNTSSYTAQSQGFAYILDKGIGDNSGPNGEDVYYLIVNTEYLTSKYPGAESYIKAFDYTTFDMKGFEYLPYKGINLYAPSNSSQEAFYLKKVIKTGAAIASPTIVYFSIPNLNRSSTLDDISGFDKALVDGAKIVLGTNIRVKDNYLKYDPSVGLTLNTTKTFNVSMTDIKTKNLFVNKNSNNTDDFDYLYLKQEILKTITGSSPKIYSNYSDLYQSVNVREKYYNQGFLTNITMYHQIQNHPINLGGTNLFDTGRTGTLINDTVFNRYSFKNNTYNTTNYIAITDTIPVLTTLITSVNSYGIKTYSNGASVTNNDYATKDRAPMNYSHYVMDATSTLVLPRKLYDVSSGKFVTVVYYNQESNGLYKFLYTEYPNYWVISLTNESLDVTAYNYKFDVYKAKNLPDFSTGSKTYYQSALTDKRGTLMNSFYVDINAGLVPGNRQITNVNNLELPNKITILGTPHNLTYSFADSDDEDYLTIEVKDKYTRFKLPSDPVTRKNIIIRIELDSITVAEFKVDAVVGNSLVVSENVPTMNSNLYVEVKVDNEGNIIPGSLVDEVEGTYEYLLADDVFDSKLLMTDIFYGGTISFGETDYLQHNAKIDGTNDEFFPVVRTINGIDSYVLTKEQIAKVHYFSVTGTNGSSLDFRAQATLKGIQIFPLTHIRLGYVNESDVKSTTTYYRAFMGNDLSYLKDMKLVEFTLAFKHTSISISDWSFLFNSRDTLTKFIYGGVYINHDETYGTTHDDFSFLLSFDNLEKVILIGAPGIENTQSFKYFVTKMYLKHKANIVSYYVKTYTNKWSGITASDLSVSQDINTAVPILDDLENISGDFEYTNNYELKLKNSVKIEEDTLYLLPSYIYSSGLYYKIRYSSLSNFLDIHIYDETDTEITEIEYDNRYKTFILANPDRVDDYDFVKNYKIYAEFKNLEDCLTNHIMLSIKIESNSKLLDKNEILAIDQSSAAAKTTYQTDYYDGAEYVYTPYSYERLLSFYVDHLDSAYE
ncbi:MAG: leucine-rich repeat domain-containing protein [Acholeplasmatales bacterium]|nr:leucine-rich repeat domain-containing protein [Acholeplasmatales bacterium]